MINLDPTSRCAIFPSGLTFDFVKPGMSRVVGRIRGVDDAEFWRNTGRRGLLGAVGRGVSVSAGPTPSFENRRGIDLEQSSFATATALAGISGVANEADSCSRRLCGAGGSFVNFFVGGLRRKAVWKLDDGVEVIQLDVLPKDFFKLRSVCAEVLLLNGRKFERPDQQWRRTEHFQRSQHQSSTPRTKTRRCNR